MTTAPTPIPGPNPLTGVKVVSLALNLPGPLAAVRLASMGASVVKVEPPTGDPLRAAAPGWYDELVAGQEVLTLDLKDPESRTCLESLLAEADILLTATRPSALERLGLLQSVERHGLVLVEIVGYAGDRADEAGHDLTYQAAYGILPSSELPRVPLVDMLGAERAVSSALAGLRLRDAGVRSPLVRVVLDEVAQHAGAGVRHGITGPGGLVGGASPAYNVYSSADGHVAVAAIEPHFTQRLASAVGRTHEELAARFSTMPSTHWESLGQELDIPIVAVRDPRDPARASAGSARTRSGRPTPAPTKESPTSEQHGCVVDHGRTRRTT